MWNLNSNQFILVSMCVLNVRLNQYLNTYCSQDDEYPFNHVAGVT